MFPFDTRASRSRRARESISAILTAHGNGAPTRTPTDCCASTSPKGPISACQRDCGPERRLIGRHPQRRLTGFSYQPTKIVLRRPLNPPCEPLTPFCLSSGDSRGVDFLAALRDEREDLSGKVTLQGSNGVELGMPFGKSASDVVLGPLVGSHATDGDDVQRAICRAISSTIEPMPDGPSGRRWNRADAA